MIAEISAKGAAPKAFGDIAEAITGRQDMKRGRRGALDFGSLFGKVLRKPNGHSGKGA
jgi:hypothetical protein